MKDKNSKFTKFKKGDNVKVVSGKDKGRSGKIEKVFPKIQKVLVSGVNEYKRHKKGNGQNQKSEIVTIRKPLSAANIILVCPKCNLETRVGFEIEDGKKERRCLKCQQKI